MTRDESMWYCPKCRTWVGRKLDECVGAGHERPRYPLYYDDVDVDHAHDVTAYDRLSAKLRGVLNDVRGGA